MASVDDFGHKSTKDAITDLLQFEQLQEQAERMKGLGNKHMADQEYTKAYNAYSAALQLSPVGPSSHIFLANRAAALLSLKQFSQAALDAQRSINMSPNFSKAYARLGQALYFSKKYEESVRAYETAVRLDPNNEPTKEYLDKARQKLLKRQTKKKQQQNQNQHRVHFSAENSSSLDHHLWREPDYTQDNNNYEKKQKSGEIFARDIDERSDCDQTEYTAVSTLGGESATPTVKLRETLHKEFHSNSFGLSYDEEEEEEDPDEIEAKRLYDRGNQFLQMKEYRYAIDEYSAALFLCPDHPLLSFQLYVARANAQNHDSRHDAAASDARMAIGLRPDISHGYSLLGRSLFYLKDFGGSVLSLEEAIRLAPDGEPNIFDKAYLQKAKDALECPGDEASFCSYQTKNSVVPKLRPPRFESREHVVMGGGGVLPPMPNSWPKQARVSTPFRVGQERICTFGAGPLGIKLNRGPDGIVRVLSTCTLPVHQRAERHGDIHPGDVVRETAGVDLRRPITNIMWGDTVALMKMAPRPISLLVAKELSKPPSQVLEELERSAAEDMEMLLVNKTKKSLYINRSSFASLNDEAVEQIEAKMEAITTNNNDDNIVFPDIVLEDDGTDPKEIDNTANNTNPFDSISKVDSEADIHEPQHTEQQQEEDSAIVNDTVNFTEKSLLDEEDSYDEVDSNDLKNEHWAAEPQQTTTTDDDELGAEILFDVDSYESTSSLGFALASSWKAGSKTRKLKHFTRVMKFRKGAFWNVSSSSYSPRILALYRDPAVVLILRKPMNIAEIKKLTNLHKNVKLKQQQQKENILDCFLVAESVIDPNLCKLRLSPLTTETSFVNDAGSGGLSGALSLANLKKKALPNNTNNDPRRSTCFEIVTPTEKHIITVALDEEMTMDLENLTVETSCWEVALTYFLVEARNTSLGANLNNSAKNEDQGWRHQIVLGTLHSHVVLGDLDMLQAALTTLVGIKRESEIFDSKKLKEAQQIILDDLESPDNSADNIAATTNSADESSSSYRPRYSQHSNIDITDDVGWTALHYACKRRASSAVNLLVLAGADCTVLTPMEKKSPCHLSAETLDHASISILLAAPDSHSSERPDPNICDAKGRTPMYLAATQGRTVGGNSDAIALKKCLSALEAWGGHFFSSSSPTRTTKMIHPVSVFAKKCQYKELEAIMSLESCSYYYPLSDIVSGETYTSLGEKFDYPMHAALISLRKRILCIQDYSMESPRSGVEITNDGNFLLRKEKGSDEILLQKTLKVLLDYGFEPNERLRTVSGPGTKEMAVFYDFTPLQILTLCSMEAKNAMSNAKENISSDEESQDKMDYIKDLIHEVADAIGNCTELLVRSGARLDGLDAPQEIPDKSSIHKKLDRSKLKLDGSDHLFLSLGGKERLRAAQRQWSKHTVVQGTGKIILRNKDAFSSSNKNAKSHSSDTIKDCEICGVSFGILRHRKHTCRVSGRMVCEGCSSKRIQEGGDEFRVSDGQFLRGLVEAKLQKSQELKMEQEKRQARKQRLANLAGKRYGAAGGGRNVAQEEEENQKKKELFGGNIKNAVVNFFMEEVPQEEESLSQQQQQQQRQLDGLASKMGETKDALLERGQKLNTLADKTSALAEQSKNFADMAKELRQQQEKGFFSFFD